MRNRFFTILLSLSAAIILLSGSYAKWEKELYINGSIRVVPDPAVLTNMEDQLNDLKMQLEEQKNFEEQQRLLAEQQKLEQQRLLEEQGAMEQNDIEQKLETDNSQITEDILNDINQGFNQDNAFKNDIEEVSQDENYSYSLEEINDNFGKEEPEETSSKSEVLINDSAELNNGPDNNVNYPTE